jgi:hypothetical protein
MDRPERIAPRLEGARCAACGGPVPAVNLRILARRDDLAFVEVACPACRSAGLAIVVGATGTLDGPIDWEAPAIAADDVAAVHEFLAGYRGDVHGLFAGSRRVERGPSGGDSHGSAA